MLDRHATFGAPPSEFWRISLSFSAVLYSLWLDCPKIILLSLPREVKHVRIRSFSCTLLNIMIEFIIIQWYLIGDLTDMPPLGRCLQNPGEYRFLSVLYSLRLDCPKIMSLFLLLKAGVWQYRLWSFQTGCTKTPCLTDMPPSAFRILENIAFFQCSTHYGRIVQKIFCVFSFLKPRLH